MSKRYKILFLGTAGFPFGKAEVEKMTLIARSLVEQCCHVTVVCKKSFDYDVRLPFRGKYEGISYVYTSLFTRRLSNRLLNRIVWILGDIIEKFYLLFNNYDLVIANSRSYSEIRWYSLITHLKKKKIFLTHVEDLRCLNPNPNRRLSISIQRFEQKVWRFLDGVFPISEELASQIKIYAPDLPQMKIPILVDFDYARNVKKKQTMDVDGKYFMYCGTSVYVETIDFIIKSFEMANTKAKLLLVLHGTKSSSEYVTKRIEASILKERIILKSDMPKEELWNYYQNALALLIPMNFNQRDKARFPHKLGEYCACKSPIITSNWGEIPVYFTNNKECIMVDNPDEAEYARAMNILYNNEDLRRELSSEAWELGKRYFDYKLYGNKIIEFYNTVVGNK